MPSILECTIIFLMANNNVLMSRDEEVSKKFKEFGVVPDVICVAPCYLAEVEYPDGARVVLGNELSATEMTTPPAVDYIADPNSFYTLAMVDPDVPSRSMPMLREFLHMLVGNIPGNDVANGDTVATYRKPAPPPGSGPHRYVFLIFEQPKRIDFNKLNFTTYQLRTRFSISNFARKYNLGNPLFGSFCQVQILAE